MLKILILFALLFFQNEIGGFIISWFGIANIYLSLFIGSLLVITYIFIAFDYYKVEKFFSSFSKRRLTREIVILTIAAILILKVIPLMLLIFFRDMFSSELAIFKWPSEIVSTILLGSEFYIIAPFVEELSFRGIIYSGLKNKLPLIWSLVLSSLIFALFHTTDGFIYSFIVGIVLAYIYEKTNSLRYPILLHGVLNFLTLIGSLVI